MAWAYARQLAARPENDEPLSLDDATALVELLAEATAYKHPPRVERALYCARYGSRAGAHLERNVITVFRSHGGWPGFNVMTIIHELAHFLAPPIQRPRRDAIHHAAFKAAELRLLALWRGKESGQAQ